MSIFEGSFTNASTLKVGIVTARFNDLITNKIQGMQTPLQIQIHSIL